MPEDRERRNARQAEYMRQRRAAGVACRYVERRCAGCGADLRVRADKRTSRCGSCSRSVSARAAASRRNRAALVPYAGCAPRPIRSAAVTMLPPSRPRWYAGYCRSCSRPYLHDQPQTLTCSRVCAKRLARERRRALSRDAFVEPVRRGEIFARDGYRCKLCGDPLAMAEKVPHPLAPTIDHVTPLARGGAHAPSNVQAAHFLCNSRKGDNVLAFCSGE